MLGQASRRRFWGLFGSDTPPEEREGLGESSERSRGLKDKGISGQRSEERAWSAIVFQCLTRPVRRKYLQ